MSRLCEEIDVRAKAFLERPIEGDWPYVCVDATKLKLVKRQMYGRAKLDLLRARLMPPLDQAASLHQK